MFISQGKCVAKFKLQVSNSLPSLPSFNLIHSIDFFGLQYSEPVTELNA